MNVDSYPTVGELWVPDAEIPQIVCAMLTGQYDGGLEIWRVGVCRIRVKDLQPPKC